MRTINFPDYVMLEPTSRCNLRCVSCNHDEVKPFGSMPLDRFYSIAEELKTGGTKTVKLQGMGESFLHPQLLTMASVLNQAGISIISITNGQVTRDDLEELIPNFKSVFISIDGGAEQSYEKIRVGASWNKVLDTASKIQKIAVRHKVNTEINCVLHAEYLSDLPNIINVAEQVGVGAVRLQIPQVWTTQVNRTSDAIYKINKSMAVINYEGVKLIADTMKKAKRKGIEVTIIGNPFFTSRLCVWPAQRTYITWDGHLIPCHMRPVKQYSMGIIQEKVSVSAVWEGDTYNKLRKDLYKSDILPDLCGACPYKSNAIILCSLFGGKQGQDLGFKLSEGGCFIE